MLRHAEVHLCERACYVKSSAQQQQARLDNGASAITCALPRVGQFTLHSVAVNSCELH